jgi:hypothetical protein
MDPACGRAALSDRAGNRSSSISKRLSLKEKAVLNRENPA